MSKTRSRFSSISEVFASAAEILQKPNRMTVTEVAEQYVMLRRNGRSTHWEARQTPYMVEPQNLFASRELSALIFCGPSQSGKTESLILNTLAYSVMQDPMDTIIFSPTRMSSRDFAMRRVDRLNHNSPAIREKLLQGASTDSRSMKIYASGMILALSWPSVSEMSGKPIGRVALTDYDRMSDSIGDEGSPFDLAYMRTTTFGSLAITVAESSPSKVITDPGWIAATPHQAPPTTGILGLYNRGDRRRWYWPCPKCGYYFEGKFSHLKWQDRESAMDAGDTVVMVCPTCDGRLRPIQRATMQDYGEWLKDGQSIRNGRILGDGERNRTASFWLNGVAAGFQTWQEIVVKFINATREFELTGSEETLRQFYNNDLGEPYLSKASALERLPEILSARAEELPEQQIPPGVRLLVATIDVQKSAFVVQIHGISPGVPFDITIIDRFTILKSNRFDSEGDRMWVKPGTEQEDWDLIISEVMLKTYPLSDGSGRAMMVKLTACDSGGADGVTTNAYMFYRKLRSQGLANRFQLVKGNPHANSPRTYVDYPDQKRKTKLTGAQGDVPVMMLNSNVLKDALSNRLDSMTPGKGMIRFPRWLQHWFYKELCIEQRTEKGWKLPHHGARNEAFDLLYYCLGVCASRILLVEQIDWMAPPGWADEWDKNPLVVKPEPGQQALTTELEVKYDFGSLGKAIA